MVSLTFDEFEQQKRDLGFDEVVPREWTPNHALEVHRHPFEVDALVVRGEFWLTCEGNEPRHLASGDGFVLPADVPHSERYGAEGATVWVARKHRR